jgi:hypothetical protein
MGQTPRRIPVTSSPASIVLALLAACSPSTTSPASAGGLSLVVSPSAPSVVAGHTIQFGATLGGSVIPVTWSVPDSNCGSVSGAGFYTAPAVVATTTCHVVAVSNADGTKSASAVVTVLGPVGSGPSNRLGINVGSTLVWDAAVVFADAMRQGTISGSSFDANGWPLSATFTVQPAVDLTYANGTWTVYFDGTASVSGKTISGPGGTGPDGLPVGPNTRWFTHTVSTAGRTSISFSFTGAARNDGSGLPGLTNIKVMRPSTQGAATSNRRDETIHRQVKSLVQRFGTARYMDFLATNWSQITTWGGYPWQPGHAYSVGDRVTTCVGAGSSSACGKVLQATVAGTSSATATAQPNPSSWGSTVTDGGVTWQWVGWGRSLPTWSGFDRNEGSGSGNTASAGATFGWQGRGGSYEDIIKFSNESGTDAWINIPAQVDDDYLTRVAQLFAFGSDGAMPYTSPQANPVYPPLSSNLNLYIEYANEVWLTGGFSQNGYVNAQAASAGLLQYQYVGRQMAKISNAFRTAFGDSEMPYTGNGRIRPLVMGQGGNLDQTAGHALKWIHEIGNDADGTSHAADRVAIGLPSAAHPIGYYLYGAGGTNYWYASGSTAADVLSSMTVTGAHNAIAKMNRHVSVYGLPLIAYEGGPEVPQNATGTAANMTDRPSSPNMRDVIVDHYNNWHASGGDLFVHFTLATDPRWCVVGDDGYRGNIYLDSPKLLAIDELRASAPAPITLSSSTFQNGTAVPGTAAGGAYALGYSDATYAPMGSGTGSTTLTGSNAWSRSKGWAFLVSDTTTRAVSATLSGGGTVRCFVDGVQLGTDQTATGTVQFGSLSLGPGLHGVIITAVSGSATVASVGVN